MTKFDIFILVLTIVVVILLIYTFVEAMLSSVKGLFDAEKKIETYDAGIFFVRPKNKPLDLSKIYKDFRGWYEEWEWKW